MVGRLWDESRLPLSLGRDHTAGMFRRAAIFATALVVLSASNVAAATTTVTMADFYFTPKTPTIRLGNSVRWKNSSTRKHSATPTVNWSWGGVTVSAGTTSAAASPTQAGSFPYFCSFHPSTMKGTIKVPMTVSPLAGTTATYFSLTLGTATTPGVLVHQVETRLNGGVWTLRVTTAAPTVSIFFPQAGTYGIRTRLRYQLGGATSGWSPITTVQVF